MKTDNILSIELEITSGGESRCESIEFSVARNIYDIPKHELVILKRYVELMFAYFCTSTSVQDIDNAKEHVHSLDCAIDVAIASNDVSNALGDCRARIEELLRVCFYIDKYREGSLLKQDLDLARESSQIEFMSVLNKIREYDS